MISRYPLNIISQIQALTAEDESPPTEPDAKPVPTKPSFENVPRISTIEKLPYAPNVRFGRGDLPGLECLQILEVSQSREGFGAVVKRNQGAVLLASYYNAKLQFPELTSVHGYNYAEMFDECGVEMDDEYLERCTLHQKNVLFEFCERGDCECMAGQYGPALKQLVDRGCATVAIMHDSFKRIEFSGCLSMLKEKFGSSGDRPKWEYDVIHYRMGDLADKPGGKSFSMMELWVILRMFCRMSDRDIVIVTEGVPEVPDCGDRVVIADTNIEYSMQIFQHAKWVASGVSSFSYVLMEFATPERVIMKYGHALRYEFVSCENWTIVDSKSGANFHFKSKKDMVEMITSSRMPYEEWIFRRRKEFFEDEMNKFNVSVPKRIWKPEMMKPTVLNCRSCED